MDYIVTAFTKDELSQKIKRMLLSSGIQVSMMCHSRDDIIRTISEIESGVLIMGYKLADATADTIYEDLPKGFSMLVLASSAQISMVTHTDIMLQKLPITTIELAAAVNILLKNGYIKSTSKRKEEDKKIIEAAKLKLMEKSFITEDQAHRFIQKRSMDMGVHMADVAKMILGY